MTDLSAAPFHLDEQAQEWVSSTLAGMDTHAKVGQLFCLMTMAADSAQLDAEMSVIEPAGYMLRPLPAAAVNEVHRHLQDKATVPMLLAANLECGADGLIQEGTSFGSEMQVAATDDEAHAYRMGVAAAKEARALGGNWGFSPICDIQFNFRNPITNTRCFGSDPQRVARMTAEFVRGLEDNAVASSTKHFPGDGVDDRDQHLVTSVNTLTAKEWDDTFGMVYRTAIEAGTKTIMIGHIAQPAKTRQHAPGIADKDILPASLSAEMIGGVLRQELGFNGLVVTDASLMNGFTIPMPRADAVPGAIAAGCDMFLFSQNLAQDVAYMEAGVASGVITAERLDDAVTRVLALKASLGLHTASLDELVPGLDAFEASGRQEHAHWAAASAASAITLVKNLDDVVPLDVDKHRRVLIYFLQDSTSALMSAFMAGAGAAAPVDVFADALRDAGFEPTVFVRPEAFNPMDIFSGADAVGRDALLADFDLVIYLAKMPPASNGPTIRLNWTPLTANDSPKYLAEIPTVFVSLGSPFHLQDVPRIPTFINAYASTQATIESVVDKLVGRSEFTGVSPVDPFCGYWDTHL